VTGWVIDSEGFPVEGAKGQLCVRQAGADTVICLRPGDTDANGVFTVELPEANRCITGGTFRVLIPSTSNSTAYCHFDPSNDAGFVQVGDPFQLHPTDPAGATGAGDITFADGLVLKDVDPEHLPFGEDIADLAAGRLTSAAGDHCFLEEAMDGLYAFSPEFNVPQGMAYAASIPNTSGLADGTVVDLYVLGGLSCVLDDETPVPEGELAKFGTGTVMGDVIETNDGVPCIGWLGYKAQ
jgi:hypothetical protein